MADRPRALRGRAEISTSQVGGTPVAEHGAVRSSWLLFAALAPIAACVADAGHGGPGGLGTFGAGGKADELELEVAFEVPAADGDTPGRGQPITFEACAPVAITVTQEGEQPLTLVAESAIYQRPSFRGIAPHLLVPGEQGESGCTAYSVEIENRGAVEAKGVLRVGSRGRPDPGVSVVFNQPDCDDGCTDPTGGVRRTIVDTIQSARKSIDMAIYGLDDPPIVEALCNAVRAGVEVRVVADDGSEQPMSTRSYYESLFGPNGLAGCGAQVEAVRSSGIMHHKVLIVDRGTKDSVVLAGSTNFTDDDIDKSHNHVTLLRGFPELEEAFAAELGQLLRHCASERLDERTDRCTECLPSCVENFGTEGPWTAEGTDGDDAVEVTLFVSPADDPMRALRGRTISRRKTEPQPECQGDDADCICRVSGANWSCDYCAQGDDGWGLVGTAEERIVVNAYSLTDQCLSLAIAKAARRGVEVLTVWDMVMAAGQYSRDDYLCAEGVATYVSNWSDSNPLVRNHSKTIVIDDTVADGSMNLSDSGANENNENVLLMRGGGIADAFARYAREEAALLERRGVEVRAPEACRCSDLIDNDDDGVADAADGDCDAGS